MKTRTVTIRTPNYGLMPGRQHVETANYFTPAPGEDVGDFVRHLAKVLEEQDARIERFEYYLADIYDRFRKLGALPPEDAAQLGRINELMAELETRAGRG